MIRNDCRLSSSAAAGRDGTGRIPHSSLCDAANPSGEFDCARLREMLVGKYAEAKGGSIVKLLQRTPESLKGRGASCIRWRLRLPPPWALTSSRTSPAWGSAGLQVGFGHVICQTKEPYPIIRGLQAVPVWTIWQCR